LASEHCHLVTEYEDFDGQFFAFVQAESEQLEHANEGDI
jgi:hypothetical protein